MLLMLNAVTGWTPIFAYGVNLLPIYDLLAWSSRAHLWTMLSSILSILSIRGTVLSQILTLKKTIINVNILRGVVHMGWISTKGHCSGLPVLAVPAPNVIPVVKRGLAILSTRTPWALTEIVLPLHLLNSSWFRINKLLIIHIIILPLWISAYEKL